MGRLWRILVLAAIVGIVFAVRWAGRRVLGPAEQSAASAGLDALKARLLERARGMAAGRGEERGGAGASLAGRVVRAGTGEAVLPVRATATLRGMVRDAPQLFRVDLRDNDDRSETFLGTDGALEMHGVPALPMRVVVIAEGLTTVEQITPDHGGTLSLELTLAPRLEALDTMPEGDDDEGEEVPGDEAIGEVTEEPEGADGAN